MSSVLTREFYNQSSLAVARKIIGKKLVRKLSDDAILAGIIVEAEAYAGRRDPASHAYRGMTARNEVMFGEPGHAYVYFTYGAHYCLNFVTRHFKTEEASAILIRAVEPSTGVEIMAEHRKTNLATNLASGPGKLCQAFGIDRSLNGVDITHPESPIRVEDTSEIYSVSKSERIGISVAKDRKWRFFASNNPHVSKLPRPLRQG